MAIRQDITRDYFTGEDKDLVFTIYTTDAQTTRQDITGWALSWLVKTRRTDADASALVTKTTSSGIALTTPASGVCTVSVTDTNIADLVGEKQYYHELKRTDAGDETVLSYGSFVLQQAVHD